jgi:glucan biosynthesis protein C
MSAGSAREHHWDSLRAFLMLLGIPYHAAMVYNARVLWDIQSPDKSELLTFVSGVLVTFRMPAFFIVAGYFAAMMLGRRPPLAWLRGRLTRLGVPFLTGLALLAPIQIALVDLNTALTDNTPMATALDQAARDLTHPGFDWIMHLWFLPALLAYSLIVALIWRWTSRPVPRILGRAQAAFAARPGTALALLTLAIAIWEAIVHLSHQTMLARAGLIPYLLAHGIDPYLRYLPFFFLGVALKSGPGSGTALHWHDRWRLPVFALTAAVLAALMRGRATPAMELAYNAIDGVAAILMSLLVIGIARRFWNGPDTRVDRIVDASFTIYLLHHPIIYALALLFLLVTWPPLVEFAAISIATLFFSYAAHRLIRRSPLALFLLNGLPMSREASDEGHPQSGITTLR